MNLLAAIIWLLPVAAGLGATARRHRVGASWGWARAFRAGWA